MVNWTTEPQPFGANHVPLIEGLSSVDGTTPVPIAVDPTSGALLASVVSGGGGGTQYAEGATTSPGTGTLAIGRHTTLAPSLTDGELYGLQLDSAGNLLVSGSLSVGGTTDNSAFTAGSSTGTPAMGFYHSTIDTVTDGRAAAIGITSKRAMLVNLQDSSGTEIGTSTNPLESSVTGDAVYDANNSTTVALGSSATFTGTATLVDEYEAVIVQLISDKASATDGLKFETSPDGTNWDHIHSYTYPTADAGVGVHWEESIPGKYFRIVYTNTNSAQTYFRLYTKLLKQAATAHTHPINYDIDVNHPAAVTRAVITGETTAGGGGLVNVKVNPSGTLEANVNQSTAANLNATVVGTGTFAVQAAQSGTWNITNVSGTVSDVRQATAANLNATVVGTGTFAVQNTPVAPSSVYNGKTTVTTAGTRVVLAASQAVKSVTIKALQTNTGIIYVGSSTVSSTNGFQLYAGDSVSLDIANLNTVNIDSSVNGEGVTYAGTN